MCGSTPHASLYRRRPAQQVRQLGNIGGNAPGRWIEPGAAMVWPHAVCVAGAAVSGYAAGGHRIGAVRGSTAAASGGQCGKEVLGPGFTVGAFFCRARFFHWNAGAAPLCRRKPATKGRRLLCAAADASLLPYVHSVSLCAPQSGFLAPARLLPGLFLKRVNDKGAARPIFRIQSTARRRSRNIQHTVRYTELSLRTRTQC